MLQFNLVNVLFLGFVFLRSMFMYSYCYVQGQSIKKPNFFSNLLLNLQLNPTFLLQSTPLHSLYTPLPTFFPVLERVLERVLRDGAKIPIEISSISSTV